MPTTAENDRYKDALGVSRTGFLVLVALAAAETLPEQFGGFGVFGSELARTIPNFHYDSTRELARCGYLIATPKREGLMLFRLTPFGRRKVQEWRGFEGRSAAE